MEKVKVLKDNVLSFFLGDELYLIFLRKMNISWWFFDWKSLIMSSTFGMKNKKKSVETQDLVEGKETWVFIDIECKIDQKISFQCNPLFQAFFTCDYHMLLQYDMCKELSKDIYKNISKFGLYKAVAKPLILLCPDVVEWIPIKVDHSNKILLNFNGKQVVRYHPYIIHGMYHLKEPHIKITREWLQSSAETIDYLTQMKGWWDEGNL